MKIQCDVCEKEEASIFCTADESALCEACNLHVHDANKLAGKHLRFSLLRPSLNQYPHCDICQSNPVQRMRLADTQSKPTYTNTQQVSSHRSNAVDNRRIIVSSSSRSASASNAVCYDTNHHHHRTPEINSSATSGHVSLPNSNTTSGEGSVSATSSISEYLTQTLHGWHVEDFLDPLSSPYGFCT